MFRPVDNEDRKAREPPRTKKFPMRPFRGFGELKKTEILMKEDLIAIKAKLVATEAEKRDLEETLEKAQDKIQTLCNDIGSLQQDQKNQLDRQENRHIAEIEEIGIVNAAEIERLTKQIEKLTITSRATDYDLHW
ncbi:uncharacterized protein LOC134196424 isoform X2 [Corticium candelabrum]|uniref:uncharacterized protein LOC134196424 isoform X2 n=1 Tax=Corticium candelabrum TaxID=121492 RepID=UPI002E25CA99|nr:uncharacterized protein LOC134196424 isoform X2 [Corticium candelabrum]